MRVKFSVPGRPIPAVRMTRKGKHVNRRAQSYLAYKDSVGWAAVAAGVKMSDKLLEIQIRVFVMGPHIGDWDNYGKSICDGLNGVAYDDDQQIKRGTVEVHKVERCIEQRAEVEIREYREAR